MWYSSGMCYIPEYHLVTYLQSRLNFALEINTVSGIYWDCVDVGIVRRLTNCICSPPHCIHTQDALYALTSTASGVLHLTVNSFPCCCGCQVVTICAVCWTFSFIRYCHVTHRFTLSSARGTPELNCDWFNYSICPPPSVLVRIPSSVLPLTQQPIELRLYSAYHLLQVRETACLREKCVIAQYHALCAVTRRYLV
jgi:hypothetical protein